MNEPLSPEAYQAIIDAQPPVDETRPSLPLPFGTHARCGGAVDFDAAWNWYYCWGCGRGIPGTEALRTA